jgi:hypothetical protein
MTMMSKYRVRGQALIALALLLIATVLVVPAEPTQAAEAGPAARVATGKVRGAVVRAGGGPVPRVKMLWFASDWSYLGARKVGQGVYSLELAPGRYYLQFVDQRPGYDVTKLRPATVSVQVTTAHTTLKNVRMFRGASIGGVVRAGGRAAAGARVVAASTDEQSFETTADSQGRFALGGLPAGSYSVFTYDRRGTWVGRSTFLRRVRGTSFRTVNINLTKKAGSMLVDLYAGDQPFNGVAFLTIVSRATGQFWTARAARGSVTFTGLFPGRYRLQVPGVGNYLPATVNLSAVVRAGRVTFGSARLTRRGGWVTGAVVDGMDGHVLKGALVRLVDANGSELDRTTSSASGAFTLDGQLTTRSGLSVLAGPGPYSDYLDNCKYRVTRIDRVSVTTNRQTSLGGVGLAPAADTPAQCLIPTRSPTT